MTQQYLVGEMSLLLAHVQALAGDDELASRVSRLRREAEEHGVCALAAVGARALELADRMCWRSLRDGDLQAFDRQAAASAELREFEVCAGLLPGG
jgi:hypothetical protein